MRNKSLATGLSLLLALVFCHDASAIVKSCNTQAVTYGICGAVDNLVLCYDAPQAIFVDLRDAMGWKHNYQTQVTCASSRQFEPLMNGAPSKVLAVAGVSSGDCTSGQVGQAVNNPQDKGAFADAILQLQQRNLIIEYKTWLAQQQIDPVNVPTPAVGQ